MDAKYTHFSDSRRSMIQSAVNEYLNRQANGAKGLNHMHERILALNAVLHRSDGTTSAQPLWYRFVRWLFSLFGADRAGQRSQMACCLSILEAYVDAKLSGNQALAQQKIDELRYSDCDPDWICAMTSWFTYYVDRMKQPQYVTYHALDDFSYTLPAVRDRGIRIGLIGDWGTGEPIAEAVLDGLFRQKPDVIIHVGDIYYSGTEQEYRDHFLGPVEAMRIKHSLPVPVYNLPGNHDYYSGGHGFYHALRETNATLTGVPTQEASYFALSSDAWHIQAMDTGFHDNDVLKVATDTTWLQNSEVAWHQHQLDKAVAQGKKVILLSHHQLFSRYMAIGGMSYNQQLMDCFGPYIQQCQIAAWFWGHEHLIEIYKPFMGLDKGRCIGNGAVPIFYNDGQPYQTTATNHGQPIADLPESLLPISAYSHNGDVYDQGFAVLTLHDDQTGTASYYAVNESQPDKILLIYEEGLGAGVPVAMPSLLTPTG